jgi:hypothetical protein
MFHHFDLGCYRLLLGRDERQSLVKDTSGSGDEKARFEVMLCVGAAEWLSFE